MLKQNKKDKQDRHRWLLIGFLCLFGVCLVAQVRPTEQKTKATGTSTKSVADTSKTTKKQPENKKTKVYLLHADEGQADKLARPDVQVLIGNVKMRHDSMYMYCDSALIFEKTNSVEAFSNVRMEQGDTLFIYGDYLYYDGMTQIAQLRENVKMINRNTTLLTDSLNYDRLYDLGYYFEGGTLMDEENVLTSDWGQYSPPTRQAVFNYNVKLENPKFTLISDTLNYNTLTSMAEIVGPSNIDSGDNHIYSESGFYNTQTEEAILLDRSIVTNKGRKMVGDSLYYDSKSGVGEGFRNVVYTDEVNKNMLTGNYCYYNDSTGYSMATDSAVAIDYSQRDTMYMHADTFKVYTFYMDTDSMYREVRGYHKVRSYRMDVQSVCDSLVFDSRDTCITMYRDPIVWNGGQQVLGEVIKVYLNDSTIDRIHVIDQTLSVDRIDSVHYNQVAGKEMTSYFRDGEMYETWVNGNVYVDYYMFDDDSLMIGLNYTETTELKLFMKDRKMEKIWMPASTGVIYPIVMIPPNRLYLSNFAWFDYIRPLNKDDIFVWRPKKSGTELKVSYKHKAPLQSLDQIKKK